MTADACPTTGSYILTTTPKQREVISLSCNLYGNVLRGNLNEAFKNFPYDGVFSESRIQFIKDSLKVTLPEILIDNSDGFDTFLPFDHPSLKGEAETCLLLTNTSHPLNKGGSSTVSKVELQVIMRACDVYARTLMGQVDMSIDNLPLKKGVDYSKVWTMKRFLQPMMSQVLIHGVDGWSSSLGVGSPDLHPNSNIAVDIYHVIRHKLSWESAVDRGIVESESSPRKWPEMLYVSYDDPFHWGSEPLCTLTSLQP